MSTVRISTLDLGLRISPTGSFQTVQGSDAVLQAVALLLATPQGSRALVPEFGCPALPTYAGTVPAWNRELEQNILLLSGVRSATVQAALDLDGTVRGTVQIRTDGGELLQYALDTSRTPAVNYVLPPPAVNRSTIAPPPTPVLD